jgi:hypothetical protein
MGQPGFPVILTSIGDDSVGAGFGVDGRPAFDTDNNGSNSTSGEIVLPFGPEVDRGTLIDNDVDVNRPGFFSFEPSAGGDGSFATRGGITAQGNTQLFIDESVIFAFNNYIDVGGESDWQTPPSPSRRHSSRPMWSSVVVPSLETATPRFAGLSNPDLKTVYPSCLTR